MPLISVVTPLFPIADEPYRGKPIYQTVLALQQFADIEVICPIAVYPPMVRPRSFRYRRSGDYRPAGIERVEYLEYMVFPYLTRPLNGYLCARRLYPRLAASRADLVLSFWLYPDGYAAVQGARRAGKPVVVSARGSDLLRITDPLTRRHVRFTLRNADAVLTVSRQMETEAIRLGADPQRARTIPNGLDQSVFHFQPGDDARSQLKLPDDARVILFVGRMYPEKGLGELLEAFRELAAEDPLLQLVAIGEGPFAARIREFAGQTGLAERIHLPGVCSGSVVAQWMNAAAMFCLPSYSEGCPNVVVEAMACGCPVVASNVGGIPELLTAESGIMVPPRDKAKLTAALRAALSRTWDRAAMAAASSRSWKDVASEVFSICQAALSHR